MDSWPLDPILLGQFHVTQVLDEVGDQIDAVGHEDTGVDLVFDTFEGVLEEVEPLHKMLRPGGLLSDGLDGALLASLFLDVFEVFDEVDDSDCVH